MNPEDEYQLELDLDDAEKTLDQWNYSTTLSDVTVSLGDYKDIHFTHAENSTESFEIKEKVTDIDTRLGNIEKALGIPAKLNRNKEMEEKHPHIKAMAEAYELEVEKHITLELLTPPDPEEDDLPF